MKKKKTASPSLLQQLFDWPPFVFLAAGLVLSGMGIWWVHGFHPQWQFGVPAMLLGGLFLVLGFPRRIQPLPPKPEPKPWKPSFLSALGDPKDVHVWWGLLGLLAVGQLAFHAGQAGIGAAFGVFLVLGALWMVSRRPAWFQKPAEYPLSEKKWFWALMAAAALLRLIFVGTNVTGLQGDEANNLTDTVSILQGIVKPGPFVTGWGGTPTFPDYIVMVFFKLLGPRLWVARLVSAAASVATLWFFYHWCRFWFGNLASLMATFWMAVAWWFFFFSLSPFHNSILFMAEVGAFYFLEKGFRGGRRMDFWWSGLCAAVCIMNYVPGRAVPFMLAATGIGVLILGRWAFLKTYWKQLALVVLGFCWMALPFILYALKNPAEVWGRVDPSWISQEHDLTHGWGFLLKSYAWSLVSLWFPNPSVDYRFVPPGMTLVDPSAGGFILLGLGLALFSLRKSAAWVLLPGVFASLSANALARLGFPTDLAYVHAIRLSILIPFAFFAAAWGLDWLLRFERGMHRKGWGWAGWIAAAAVALSLVTNENIFIPKFGVQRGAWGDHGFDQIAMSEMVLQKAPNHHIMGDPAAYSNALTFLVQGRAAIKIFDVNQDLPIPYAATKDVLLFFAPWRATPAQMGTIHRLYPKAVWTEYRTPWDEVYLGTMEIPLDEIVAAQKGVSIRGPLP